jgi:hypothetical protein
MNRRDQSRRDTQIAMMRVAGYTEEALAQRFKLDIRTVRRAYRKWKEGQYEFQDVDPMEVVADELLRLDCALSELAMDRINSETAMDRIKAIRAQLKVMSARTQLLMDVGALPTIEDGQKSLRERHGAELIHHFKCAVSEQDLEPALGPWAQGVITDWIERGPSRGFLVDEDTSTHEDVR